MQRNCTVCSETAEISCECNLKLFFCKGHYCDHLDISGTHKKLKIVEAINLLNSQKATFQLKAAQTLLINEGEKAIRYISEKVKNKLSEINKNIEKVKVLNKKSDFSLRINEKITDLCLFNLKFNKNFDIFRSIDKYFEPSPEFFPSLAQDLSAVVNSFTVSNNKALSTLSIFLNSNSTLQQKLITQGESIKQLNENLKCLCEKNENLEKFIANQNLNKISEVNLELAELKKKNLEIKTELQQMKRIFEKHKNSKLGMKKNAKDLILKLKLMCQEFNSVQSQIEEHLENQKKVGIINCDCVAYFVLKCRENCEFAKKQILGLKKIGKNQCPANEAQL